jgi:hypothetical protein
MGISIAKILKEYCIAEYKRLLSPIIDSVCARFFSLKTPGEMIQYQHENEDPLKNPFLIFDPDLSTPTKSVYRNVAKNYGISMMGPIIVPVGPPALPPAYLHVQEVKDILTKKIILPSGLIVSSFDINPPKGEGGGLLPWLLAGAAAALAIKAST